MLAKWLRPLTWAWVIVVGALMLTPAGWVCIACGREAPGFLGDGVVRIIGLVSIVLGVLGFSSGAASTAGRTQQG